MLCCVLKKRLYSVWLFFSRKYFIKQLPKVGLNKVELMACSAFYGSDGKVKPVVLSSIIISPAG